MIKEYRKDMHVILELAMEIQESCDYCYYTISNFGFKFIIRLHENGFYGNEILNAMVTIDDDGFFHGEINRKDIVESGKELTALKDIIKIMTDRLIYLKENRNGSKSDKD